MKFAKTMCMVGVVALALQGCATTYLNNATRGTKQSIEHDTVRYMLQARSPNGQIDPNKLLILGDKYTYELSDDYYDGINIKNLNKFGEVLDLKYFKPEPIRFKMDAHSINHNFYTVRFEFDYDKQGKAITTAEKQILERYCAVRQDTAYLNCEMQFHMSMHQKFTPPQSLALLKGNYPIEITRERDNTVLRAVLKPFAIATDLVTAPFQLAAGALALGGVALSCTVGSCGQ